MDANHLAGLEAEGQFTTCLGHSRSTQLSVISFMSIQPPRPLMLQQQQLQLHRKPSNRLSAQQRSSNNSKPMVKQLLGGPTTLITSL